ncbi:MAG: MBL fold metallo-hydrolase [Clostridiales bacterium]|nr:MBL fold metallo-hydrolase [Clostridiales bacterium]
MAKVKSSTVIQLVILVLAAVAAGISCIWSYDIELATGLLHYEEVALAEGIGGSLSVYYVDVGQGDCTVVSLPDGKTIIIDGGENNKKTETAIDSFIAETFTDFKYFDYAILTHPDSDHCGSLDYALEKYPARVSYRPNVEAVGTKANPTVDPGKADLSTGAVTKDTAAYAKCITAMYAQNADFTPTVYVTDPADENQTIRGGEGDDEYSLTFFSPLSKKYSDWNDYSPIMILEYRGFKFAMSGDAEKANETEFVAKVNAAKTDGVTDKYDIFTDDFCVNAIKTGHHGSRTSTSQAYIDVMTTEGGAKNVYYIISCGDGNSYGHPHSETLNKLDGMGVPEENILRTDLVGTITLTVKEDSGEDGEGYALFYGNNKSDQNPSGPSEQEPTDPPETTKVLVYYKIGSIDITWPLAVWAAYVIFALLVLANLFANGKKSGRKRR